MPILKNEILENVFLWPQLFYYQNLLLNDNVDGTKDMFKEKEDNDKPYTNSPSYLIWSFFTKQREIKKARVLKKNNHKSAGNKKKQLEVITRKKVIH